MFDLNELEFEETTLADDRVLMFADDLFSELSLGQNSETLNRDRVIAELNFARNHNVAFLAKMAGEVIGLITVSENFALFAGGRYGVINEMIVEPRYRSHSIGQQLVNAVKSYGKHRGWLRVDVTAPPEDVWKRTINFYQNNGFRFTGPKLKCLL